MRDGFVQEPKGRKELRRTAAVLGQPIEVRPTAEMAALALKQDAANNATATPNIEAPSKLRRRGQVQRVEGLRQRHVRVKWVRYQM